MRDLVLRQVVANVARRFYKDHAESASHEVAGLAGIRGDGTWTILTMRRGERGQNHFQLDLGEFETGIRTLAGAGFTRLLRLHAGPKHLSPSHADVVGLGERGYEEELEDLMRVCGMVPPLLDVIVSQTTGRYKVHYIRQPPGWDGEDHHEGFREVDPARFWASPYPRKGL